MEIDVRELLELNVRAIVDEPEKVVVTEHSGGGHVVIYTVETENVGQVIGSNGSIAKSLRRLLTAISGKMKKKLILDISQNK